MTPQTKYTPHAAEEKAPGQQREADDWQPTESRELTLEEVAWIENRFPFYVALADWEAALKPMSELSKKSVRQIATEQRAHRTAKESSRVRYYRALIDDRIEIDALQKAVPGREPLSREFWGGAQGRYEKAQAQLAALERMPQAATLKELCWAREHSQIAKGVLDAHRLPDGRERKQALGTARKSDLHLATWSRNKLQHELRTIVQRLVQRPGLTEEQFACHALRLCDALNMSWLATSQKARPLLGHAWRGHEDRVKRAYGRWTRSIRPEEVASADIEPLFKAVLRALGAGQGNVQDVFRIDDHRATMTDRRQASRGTKAQLLSA